MYCLELIKFDVYNNNTISSRKWCIVARRHAVIENDPWRSWKIVEVMEKF